LRSILLQYAWALVRSKNGGRLKEKYPELTGRMSKTKSAAARRIITLMWALVTRREFYKDITEAELRKKLRYYKLDCMAGEGRRLPLDNNHRSHCGGRAAYWLLQFFGLYTTILYSSSTFS
jgi:hypothetical protein